MSAIVVRDNTTPALDDERIELLRKTIANGAPQNEFEMFVGVCNRTGLDPFAKQIYFIPRKTKDRNGNFVETWSWQTSIDGYRLIADRTGGYAGSDDAEFVEDNGKPVSAKVTVWKIVAGQRCPFSATARWSEYAQESSPMWKKMPYLMLGKCAEALALRKAFPAELSGIYTREEMMQADNDMTPVADMETGEILRPPVEIVEPDEPSDAYTTWVPVIEAAESLDEISEIGKAMKDAGVSSGVEREVLAVYNQKKLALVKAGKVAK